jgi:hypothetical protein
VPTPLEEFLARRTASPTDATVEPDASPLAEAEPQVDAEEVDQWGRFLDARDARDAAQDETLRRLFDGALKTGVDRKAAIIQLGRQTKAPFAFLERNFDAVKQAAEAAQFDPAAFRRENPDLVRELLADPVAAGVFLADKKVGALKKALSTAGYADRAAVPDADVGAGLASLFGQPDTSDEGPKGPGQEQEPGVVAQKESELAGASGLERLGIFVEQYRYGREQAELGRISAALQDARWLGRETYDLEKALIEKERALEAIPYFRQNPLEQLGLDAADLVASQVDTIGGALKGAGTAAAVGAATGAAVGKGDPRLILKGAKMGAKLGGTGGGLLASFNAERGSSYPEFLRQRSDDGQPVDEFAARTAATVYGAAAAVVEMEALGVTVKALGPLGDVLKGATGKAFLKAMLQNPTHRAILADAGKRYGKAILAESTEEALQNLLQDVAGYFAKVATAGEGQQANVRGAAVAAGEVALKTAGGMAVTGLPMGFVSVATHEMARERALKAGEQVRAIAQSIKDAPAAIAAPGPVASLIQKETAKTGEEVTHLFIDPKAFAQLFQRAKADPRQAALELLGDEGPAVLDEALATGGKLEVTLKDYVEKWGQTELAAALALDTATRPWAQTANEAAQTPAEDEKSVKDLVAKFEKEELAPESQAEAEMLAALRQGLTGTGKFDAKKVGTKVALWRAWVRTMAKRTGVPADELYRNVSVTVGNATPEEEEAALEAVAGPEAALAQRQRQTLSAATETPEFKAWFGDSKVLDDGGRPLVVYHGTDADAPFTAFRTLGADIGVHFGTAKAANDRINELNNWQQRIYPVFLRIKNPLRIDDAKGHAATQPTRLAANLVSQGILTAEEAQEVTQHAGRSIDKPREALIRLLEAKGYDGLVYRNNAEDFGSDSFVVFHPEQVKSPFNRGTFDAENPDILMQRAEKAAGRNAGEVLAQLEKTRLVGTDVVLGILGEFPEYLKAVAQFMLEQRQKIVEGRLTPRDVAKAYFVTIASMGSDALPQATLEAKLPGIKFDELFVNAGKVRPEEAAAHWLGTPDGKAALDAIEQGTFDEAARRKGADVRQAFGDDRFKTFQVFNPPKPRQFSFHNLADLTEQLNATRGDPDQVAEVVRRIRGIGAGKVGFIKHLLGLGDAPTLDAVEINTWLTGQGDIKQLKGRKADLAREVKANADTPAVSGLLLGRIINRFDQLRGQVPGGKDVAPEVWQHIAHHWLWDRSKGLTTTHAGMYEAMRRYQRRASPLAAAIRQAEESIRGLDFERGIFLRSDGSTLFTVDGGPRFIQFTPDQCEQMRKAGDAILVHNHPRDSTLSDDDILLASAQDLAEIRAVARTSGLVYSIKRPLDGWKVQTKSDLSGLRILLQTAKDDATKKATIRMDQRIRDAGGVPGRTDQPGYDNETWKKITTEEWNAAYNQVGAGYGWQIETLDPRAEEPLPRRVRNRQGPDAGVRRAAEQLTLFQRAFHGTHARGIDRFSLQHIGSGEGAQVYGWGIYFASRREVAEWYREKLGGSAGRPKLDPKADWQDAKKRLVAELEGRIAVAKAIDLELIEAAKQQGKLASLWGTPGDYYDGSTARLDDKGENLVIDYYNPNSPEQMTTVVILRTKLASLIVNDWQDTETAAALMSRVRDAGGTHMRDMVDDLFTAKAADHFSIADDIDQLSVDASLRSLLVSQDENATGQLYGAEVPEDDELLVYEKPLDQQPPKVLEALKRLDLVWEDDGKLLTGNEDGAVEARTWTGRNLYDSLTRSVDADYAPEALLETEGASSPEQVSRYLLSGGIPGLRYLDGSSRSKGGGAYNFVIWDEGRMPIQETFYQRKRDATSPALFDAVAAKWGTTTDPAEMGFVLPDGRPIDLSNKQWGDEPGMRALDHSEVDAFYREAGIAVKTKNETGTPDRGDYLNDFLSRGAVRTHFEYDGRLYLEVGAPLSEAQVRTLAPIVARASAVLLDVNGAEKMLPFDFGIRPSMRDVLETIERALGEKPAEPKTLKQSDAEPVDDRTPRGWMNAVKVGAMRLVRIVLTRQSDLSTFLHESGHVFMDVFAELAQRPDAPEQVREDWQTLLRYVGATDRDSLNEEQLETLARAFEAYLMEGKAPSASLRRAFERFRQWLVGVYRTIASLDVDLADDVRQVFDRMLATDAEIAHAQGKMGLAPIFKTREEAGMTRAQWEAYLADHQRILEHARKAADISAWKAKLAEKKAFLKEKEKELRAEALAEYTRLPAVRARRYLADGTITDDAGKTLGKVRPGKLDRAAVERILPEGQLRALGGLLSRKHGEDPQAIGEQFGFTSAEDFLAALVATRDVEQWTASRAAQLLAERHPTDIQEREELALAVQRNLHGEAALNMLLREWAALRHRRRAPEPGEAKKARQKGARQQAESEYTEQKKAFEGKRQSIEDAAEREYEGLQKDAAAESERLNKATAEAYDLLPAVRAGIFLRKGRLIGPDGIILDDNPDLKLSGAKAVALMGGREKLEPIALHLEWDRDGLDPAEVAQALGYEDPKAMLADLVNGPPTRSEWIAAEVDAKTKTRAPASGRAAYVRKAVDERFTDTLPERNAWLAERAKTLEAEQEAADEAQRDAEGPVAKDLPIEAVERAALQIASRRRLGELQSGRILKAEREAALNATRAAAKGDWGAAYVYKQQQILNHLVYRHLLAARKERDRFDNLAKAMLDTKRRGRLFLANPALRDVSDRILEALGIKPKDASPGVRRGLPDLLAFLESSGASPAFDPDLIGNLLENPKPLAALTLDEMRDVSALLGQIRRLGVESTKVQLGEKAVELDQLAADVAEEASGEPDQGPPPASASALSLAKQSAAKRRFAKAELLDPKAMFKRLGPTAMKMFWERYVDRRNYANDLSGKVLKFFHEQWNRLPAEMQRRRYDPLANADRDLPFPTDLEPFAPGPIRAGPRDRMWLWMLILNMGNESNKERLLGGYGWSEEQVLEFINRHVTKEEMDFLQTVWDLMDRDLYPAMAEVHERVNGIRPPKIPASPLVTKWGTYAGGYFPARYDPVATRLGKRQEDQALSTLTAGRAAAATVMKSFTKERAKHFEDVINLSDWSAVPAHVAQVIHYCAFEEFVRDGQKALEAIAPTVRRRLGIPYEVQLEHWLKVVASAHADSIPQHLKGWLGTVHAGRSRMVMASLGYSLTVAAGDLGNPLVAVAAGKVKSRHLVPQLLKGATVAGYVSMRREALAKSPELKHRAEHFRTRLMQELGGAGKAGNLKPHSRWAKAVRESAWWFMEQTDKLTSTVIWQGAYEQALAKGLDDAAAVRAADDVLQDTMPSNVAAEQPAILRDRTGVGALLAFYGYFSRVYNLNAELWHDAAVAWESAEDLDEKLRAVPGIAQAAGRTLAILFVTGVASEFLSGRGPDRDDDGPDEGWGEWLLRKMLASPFAMIPIFGGLGEMGVNKAVSAAFHKGKAQDRKLSFRAAPALAAWQRMFEAGGKALGGKNADDKAKALFEVWAVAYKLPVSQPERTAGYAANLLRGKERPRKPLDIPAGLVYGSRKDQPRNPLQPRKERRR